MGSHSRFPIWQPTSWGFPTSRRTRQYTFPTLCLSAVIHLLNNDRNREFSQFQARSIRREIPAECLNTAWVLAVTIEGRGGGGERGYWSITRGKKTKTWINTAVLPNSMVLEFNTKTVIELPYVDIQFLPEGCGCITYKYGVYGKSISAQV